MCGWVEEDGGDSIRRIQPLSGNKGYDQRSHNRTMEQLNNQPRSEGKDKENLCLLCGLLLNLPVGNQWKRERTMGGGRTIKLLLRSQVMRMLL